MKVIIANDTFKGSNITRGGHFGCQLVMQTFVEQLGRVDIEIVETIAGGEKILPTKPFDLLIVNGEGSIHSNRRRELVKVSSRYPSVLLNAVWQNNIPYEELKLFKYIAVRESYSKNAMPIPVDVVPDIIFTSKQISNYVTKATKDLGITDNVTNQLQGGDGGISAIQDYSSYIKELSSYNQLCIGRFHSIVLASLLKIPFSAWPSNTHKIEGIMHDMGISHLFFSNKKQALKNTPTTFDPRINQYVNQSKTKINEMFEKLHNFN